SWSILIMPCSVIRAEDGIRARNVTGVQTCALPISLVSQHPAHSQTRVFPYFPYQRLCSTAGQLEAFIRRVPDYFFDLTLIQTACQATSKLETIQQNARCSEAKEELMSMRKSPDLSDEPAPILQLRDIRKTFGSVVALRSGSLSVDRGSIHALTGDNGSGKSTLVKVDAGLYHRESGDFLFAGEPVDFTSTAESK